MSRPSFIKKTRKRVCIICEGFEEFEYLSKLIQLGEWSDNYYFELVNAESISNISAYYQDRYSRDIYDLILIFCDTDRVLDDNYNLLKKKINEKIFGNEFAADKVIIFVNPCTMQVILLHFGECELSTQNKNKNTYLIQQLTGLDCSKNYKASMEQREFIFSKITNENYGDMKKRVVKISRNIQEVPSTNFLEFLLNFESSDDSWIQQINDEIEKSN